MPISITDLKQDGNAKRGGKYLPFGVKTLEPLVSTNPQERKANGL